MPLIEKGFGTELTLRGDAEARALVHGPHLRHRHRQRIVSQREPRRSIATARSIKPLRYRF